MMSLQTRRRLLIILIALLLLLLLFLLWWFLKPKPVVRVVVNPPAQIEPLPVAETPLTNERQQQAEKERASTASLQSASKTFAERYGSYSTEAEFENLRDVLPLMSEAFAREVQAFIDGATPAAEYYGVTTRVISIQVDASDETAGTATVTVVTQREEAKGTATNVSVRYQNLLLTFVKEAGMWKVSSATWK